MSKLEEADEVGIPVALAEELRQAEESKARFEETGSPETLDAAVTAFHRVLVVPSFSSADIELRLDTLNDVAGLHLERYLATGRTDDLNLAFSSWELAVDELPAQSPHRPICFNNLGIALSTRFDETGQMDDLERAILLLDCSVAETPKGDDDLPSRLTNLANSLGARFEQIGNIDDLDRAIRLSEQAVALTPTDTPLLSTYLNTLGVWLHCRFDETGDATDLERTIAMYEQASKATQLSAHQLAVILYNLGLGLHQRHEQTGKLADLEDAITAYRRAVEQTPLGAPALASHINGLNSGLYDRFGVTGRLDDLEEAIRLWRRAIDLTPSESPDLAVHLNGLGSGLQALFGRTRRIADLDEAIRAFERARQATSAGAQFLPAYLNNLAVALRARFAQTGQMEDLERAISAAEEAVAEAPEGSPHTARYLNTLSDALGTRYEVSRRAEDLDRAVRNAERAVEKTPPGAPRLSRHLFGLGNSLSDLAEETRQIADRERATDCYRRACELGSVGTLQVVLDTAQNWGRWAFRRHCWEETVEAYGNGLATGRRVVATHLRRAHKEGALRELQQMSAPFAYALAKLGRLEEAVVAAERGRARLLAEALQRNRRDLEQLPSLGHDDLFRRYAEIVDILEQLTEQLDSDAAHWDDLDYQARIDSIAAAQDAFDKVVADIGRLPGYEDFLAESGIDNVEVATRDGPLAYLLSTTVGGLALIVDGAEVQPVWLDGLTDAVIQEWLEGPADDPDLGGWLGAYMRWVAERSEAARADWLAIMERITQALWSCVSEPMLEALRSNGHGDPASQAMTLIPTGLIALLPLSAAWGEDLTTPTGRRYLLDEITIRYAPSAAAQRHALGIAGQVDAEQLLVVAEPLARNATALPNSRAEVDAVSDGFTNPIVLSGAQATCSRVLAELEHTQVAHFSCHARNDWKDPLDSGLLLADDASGKEAMLRVGDLLETKGARGRLATLAACETGIVATDLPDEVVMLPSALLQAGFAGVVASLWSVPDLSTAMLMERFYRCWREDGLPPAQALRAAQRWLRDTTNGEKAEYFKRYSPNLSGLRMPEATAVELFSEVMSRDLDQRDFAHPYWWAAFYLTGT